MSLVTFSQLGRYGRFANAAFQIASTIGIARRNNFDFAFPLFINHHHRDAFGSTEDVDLYKHFVNPLPVYDGPVLPERFVDWGYHDVILTESVSLSGHMQSAKYFNHCLEEIKHYFRMKDESPQNDYVAVHYRAGDYSDGEGYHPRMTMDYYLKAFEHFPEGPTKYLVFSDDMEAAQKMFNEFDNRLPWEIEFSIGNDYIQDFKLMKRCKSFIIGNSSFSAMAALLGEHPAKRVIAPRPWFGKSYTSIDGEDIYDSGWTVIDWQRAD